MTVPWGGVMLLSALLKTEFGVAEEGGSAGLITPVLLDPGGLSIGVQRAYAMMSRSFKGVLHCFTYPKLSALTIGLWALLTFSALRAQTLSPTAGTLNGDLDEYVLGPGDLISIWALGIEEISAAPVRVSASGDLDLPLVGPIHVEAMTALQLKKKLAEKLAVYVRTPQASVTVTEFRSQTVSVLGAVRRPGVHQLQGPKRLLEVLSLAEGTSEEAGDTIRITRRIPAGNLPLPEAIPDPTGMFVSAEIKLEPLVQGKAPTNNILLKAGDVVSVPRATSIYVLGEVKKPGRFLLANRDSVTVLQALSLAEGVSNTAAPARARILRVDPTTSKRTDLAINVSRLFKGKESDTTLQPDDILFIPGNSSRRAAIKVAEAALNMGSGIAIWRLP